MSFAPRSSNRFHIEVSQALQVAPRNMDRKHRKTAPRNCVLIQSLRFRSELRRPLGSTSVNVHILTVGRPGLDPGTLGLKGHRVHYSLFIRFRKPHIHGVLRSVRSVRSVAIGKC